MVNYQYTCQPWKSPEVLQLKSEVNKLKEKNSTLKKEMASKDMRSATIFKRLRREKDDEIAALKMEMQQSNKRISELERQLKQNHVQELEHQLDVSLIQQEAETPAEDIPIGNYDDVLEMTRHRFLSQI